jgi:hypothetical protein
VKPGFDARLSRFDLAGDIFADSAFCPECYQGSFRTLSILRLKRRLQ